MAMRLSGLMSGMDTDSIVQELVAVRQKKVDTVKKAQTKLEWKQDAWKDLNKKLKNLQSKYISNMRFASSYAKKTTKVSNSSAVSVITGENAVNGVQSMTVEKLAKTAYLTGGKLTEAGEGKQWTALSKISDIAGSGFKAGKVNITTESGDVEINITKDTTISDFLNKAKEAGLNANFDANNQRLFISAKESGVKNNFSITASNEGGMSALSALGLQVGLDQDSATLAEYREFASYYVAGDAGTTLKNMKPLITKEVEQRTNSYLEQYKSTQAAIDASNKKIAEIQDKYQDNPLKSVEEYATLLDEKSKAMEELKKKIQNASEDEKAALSEQEKELQKEIETLNAEKTDAVTLANEQKKIDDNTAKLAEITQHIDVTESTDADGNKVYEATLTESEKKAINNAYIARAKYAAQVMADYENGKTFAGSATKIDGQDAEITLNGAKFTNASNTFEINGLTITALNETKGEEVTITTQDDTDGIYDMIKNFLKEYNEVIGEMDKLYNAASAKGYEPLTDEEKDAMSESEAEKYEQKIKDALLRNDSNVSQISQGIRSVMMDGITIGGKTMYLADFGIEALGYFEAADNEKNLLHIAGDPDDEYTSGKTDKLKSMIASDSSTVIDFFTTLSKNLYDKMSSMSSSIKGTRSYGSFFDDKKMTSDYNSYKTKIAELEAKLADYEDKWYKKFSKMESAMAKMQSNTNAVTALIGGGY